MLEIRELTKVYHAKEGTSVKALDSISMSLPSTGMVFILGKSGSGKSTLLNVIGGLDGCDEGEFIINGKSSKEFSPADFDAYRNTYIGFIFQEYNMLEEFSVAENVALALELQGKTADPAEVEAVLASLELEGFGDRRINELSGGQKQRVAIARALIKKPEILMADEPTGALDSETGEALFKTLKELSKEKLVLVVSHDRDFAERYGDRIIELQDGRIIADTAQQSAVPKEPQKSPKAAEKASFIRSRLSLKRAVRMGANSLNHKKLRLAMAILLAFVSFTMFGLADTMAAYEKINAVTASIQDSNIRAAVVTLHSNDLYMYADGKTETDETRMNMGISDADIARLESETGLNFIPVVNNFREDGWSSSSVVVATRCNTHFQKSGESNDFYNGNLYGFLSMDAATLSEFGFTLTGRLPAADNEIVIPEYLYRQFVTYGFGNKTCREFVDGDKLTMTEGENGILGKHLSLSMGSKLRDYTIVGVLDTGFEYDRYASLLPGGADTDESSGDFSREVLERELQSELHYGFHTLAILTESEIEMLSALSVRTLNTHGYSTGSYYGPLMLYKNGQYAGTAGFSAAMDSRGLPLVEVTWLDGTPRTALGEKEYVLSKAVVIKCFQKILQGTPVLEPIHQQAIALYGTHYDATSTEYTLYDCILTAALAAYKAEHGAAPADEDAYIKGELQKFAATVEEWLQLDIPAEYAHMILPPLLKGFYNGMTISAEALHKLRLQAYATATVCVQNLQDNQDFLRMMNQITVNGSWQGTVLEQKQQLLGCQFYEYLLSNASDPFGGLRVTDSLFQSGELLLSMQGTSVADWLSDICVEAEAQTDKGRTRVSYQDWKLVGYYDDSAGYGFDIISDTFIEELCYYTWAADSQVVYRPPHDDGIYAFAVASMPRDADAIRLLVESTYSEEVGICFRLRNQVISSFDVYNEYIDDFATVFLYVGLGFALFAALLLANFIATSVAYKKRDIGVLRALGAGAGDVFKVFLSEAAIIGLVNFLLAAVTTGICTLIINSEVRANGFKITLLSFGPRQILLLLGVSLLVALAASFVPVWRIARKKPVDAIKDR